MNDTAQTEPQTQGTPRANRVHIALFGRANSGKSSLLNALTNQHTAIVSAQKGTTTDPVYKSMELSGIGAVTFVDTAGFGDGTALGKERLAKTELVASQCDIALVVFTADAYKEDGFALESAFLRGFAKTRKPIVPILNKTDELTPSCGAQNDDAPPDASCSTARGKTAPSVASIHIGDACNTAPLAAESTFGDTTVNGDASANETASVTADTFPHSDASCRAATLPDSVDFFLQKVAACIAECMATNTRAPQNETASTKTAPVANNGDAPSVAVPAPPQTPRAPRDAPSMPPARHVRSEAHSIHHSSYDSSPAAHRSVQDSSMPPTRHVRSEADSIHQNRLDSSPAAPRSVQGSSMPPARHVRSDAPSMHQNRLDSSPAAPRSVQGSSMPPARHVRSDAHSIHQNRHDSSPDSFLVLPPIAVSATLKTGIDSVYGALRSLKQTVHTPPLVPDTLCTAGDTVLLVMPQDESAPKGRLILPQVQVLRALLDKSCTVISCGAHNFADSIEFLKTPPRLIITDSKVFKTVWEQKPAQSALTSFSVLMAAQKGDLALFVKGAHAIERLTESSRVLIAESCTHAPQTEDIGRVQIPRLLRAYMDAKKAGSGARLSITVVSGSDFPRDVGAYSLIVHCGACMFNRAFMLSRQQAAANESVPMTNYGICIAYLTGILSHVALP